MYKGKQFIIVAVGLLLALAGCARAVSSPVPLAVTQGKLGKVDEWSSPLPCTQLPTGMALAINPLSATELEINLIGLPTPEELSFVFTSDSLGTFVREVTIQPTAGSASGEFGYIESDLPAFPENVTERRWEVKLVHSRGMACSTVMMP